MARTWILVADGARARLFEQDPEVRSGFKPAAEREFSGTSAHAREIASDRPGRTFDRAGEGRHAMEPSSDPLRHAKLEFARDLAEHLRQAVGQHAFDRLIVIAAPRTLGDLRDLLPATVRERVVAEIDKDLTWMPLSELEKHVDPKLLR
jgi:protein required for attachment to host cells